MFGDCILGAARVKCPARHSFDKRHLISNGSFHEQEDPMYSLKD